MRRILLRDVPGIGKAGDIIPPTDQYFPWESYLQVARELHGVTEPLDSWSKVVDDAARKYVEGLQRRSERAKEPSRGDSQSLVR